MTPARPPRCRASDRYVGSPPGELGGNKSFARLCAGMLVGLWVLYVSLSALSAYGYINVMQAPPPHHARTTLVHRSHHARAAAQEQVVVSIH